MVNHMAYGTAAKHQNNHITNGKRHWENIMNKKQRENTKVLIQVLEDKIKRNEPKSILNKWFQPCGTLGCVAGDTYIAMGLLPENTEILPWGAPTDSEVWDAFDNWVSNFITTFGFSRYFNSLDVFGLPYEGSLQDRLNYVKHQLNKVK